MNRLGGNCPDQSTNDSTRQYAATSRKRPTSHSANSSTADESRHEDTNTDEDCDTHDDELQRFAKGVAVLFLEMIDALIGWKYRSTSATNSDARVKLGGLRLPEHLSLLI
jgi:hypothetical protein